MLNLGVTSHLLPCHLVVTAEIPWCCIYPTYAFFGQARGRGLPAAPAERGVVRDGRLSHNDQRRNGGLRVGCRERRTVRPPGRGDGELTPKDAVAEGRAGPRGASGTAYGVPVADTMYDADERLNDSARCRRYCPSKRPIWVPDRC